MNNRCKEILHPLIKNNVYTPGIINGINEFATRIFSDSYSVYNVRDFANMGFVLKKVNHSVWFCQGSFHTNSIEGLLSCIKLITNYLVGLNIKILSDLEKNGIEPQKYLDR